MREPVKAGRLMTGRFKNGAESQPRMDTDFTGGNRGNGGVVKRLKAKG
jgi:hypothetical protein